jgi:hypothetical protein
MSILEAFVVRQHFGMNNIDVKNMKTHLTIYNFGFICCKNLWSKNGNFNLFFLKMWQILKDLFS